MHVSRFFDPLYGRVDVTPSHAELLFTPEVQRLRYVRMCNINSLLLSGASEISRFEHIVGVLELAKIWTQNHSVSQRDAHVIEAAAILHDMQTGPFGHSLEYVLGDSQVDGGFAHEDVLKGSSGQYFQDISANASFGGARFSAAIALGDLWKEVGLTISGKGRYGRLIAGTVDLDNIDNVVRLAYHVGVAGRDDVATAIELVKDIELNAELLSVSAKGRALVFEWNKVRSGLYRLLLEEAAEFSAKAMLTRMVEEAVHRQLIGADSWVLTDDELLQRFQNESVGAGQEIGELARRLILGNLYQPVLLIECDGAFRYDQFATPEIKRPIERRLTRELKAGKSLIHFIKDRGKTSRAVSVWNRDSLSEEHIGQNSDRTLVGVFVSGSTVTSAAKSRCFDIVSELLELPVTSLKELADPVAPRKEEIEPQLALFDGI